MPRVTKQKNKKTKLKKTRLQNGMPWQIKALGQSLGGRPPQFTDPEEFSKKAQGYFNILGKYEIPTKAGFLLFMGFNNRDTYNSYKKKNGFSDTIKRVEFIIENKWTSRLSAPMQATGAIFYLKNAFKEEYRDRHEHDLTTNGKELPTPIYGGKSSSKK